MTDHVPPGRSSEPASEELTPLGNGAEFDLIRALVARWGTVASGIGDDAAVLDVPLGERLVVSTDSSVEDVHFRRAWLTPWEIGWRATAAALSDLAAMAATPAGVLVSLAVPRAWLTDLGDVATGIGDAVRSAGAHIVGGDMTAGRELSIALTVLGHTAQPLRRGGARPGDALYITGRLGGPLTALRALERGDVPLPEARARFATPMPRLREAQWLARHGARAAIDVSDGLLGDAAHLAAASGARLIIDLETVPTMAGASLLEAAASGEEYELLVAAPPGLDPSAFEREFHLPLTAIGRVERAGRGEARPGTGGAAEVQALLYGERVASGGGFSHFS
jgi:thiamine-monophosphate kinase